jgi:single-strand DNA-binding protein
MNKCFFAGNFVTDPESRKVKTERGEISVVTFRFAVNRKYKSKAGELKQEATFLDMEAWDSGGETIARNCKKGDYIILECSARIDEWLDKATNAKRSRVKFRVDNFYFTPGTRKQTTDGVKSNSDSEVKEEDIPF